MAQVEKLAESKVEKSKIDDLAKAIELLQENEATKIGIKTYIKNLQKQYEQPLDNILAKKDITTKSKGANIAEPSRRLTKEDIKTLIQHDKLDSVSPIPLEQPPTPLDKLQSKITKSEPLVIPNIEAIKPASMPLNTPETPDKITKQDNEDYIIVIPSYNRPDLIQVKTLALLHRHNINPNLINIFVANKEQYDLYQSNIPKFLYNEIIIGVLGLKNQRNFIIDYYPEGKHIVQMDDDLDKIMELYKKNSSTSRKTARKTARKTVRKSVRKEVRNMRVVQDLDRFIRNAFKMCHEKGIFLWGVYPLANARFMTPTVTTDLRFIVGPMWGMINRHRQELHSTIDEKENAERTLQYYTMDGAVLRFNNVGIETRYYKNKGGMQNEGKNRKEEALKSVYYLHKKYPNLTKIFLGKKSGVPEIRMIHHLPSKKHTTRRKTFLNNKANL
jgi:hypothetical protein